MEKVIMATAGLAAAVASLGGGDTRAAQAEIMGGLPLYYVRKTRFTARGAVRRAYPFGYQHADTPTKARSQAIATSLRAGGFNTRQRRRHIERICAKQKEDAQPFLDMLAEACAND
jgi:uncharacterized protein (DUF1786 family)